MKTKFGYMSCPGCTAAGRKTRVLVRINERETLSAACDECDSTEYAKKGTGKHADWSKGIERIGPAEPKPAPKVEPNPAPKVEQKAAVKQAAKMPWM